MRAVDILASRLPSVPEHTGLPATGIPLPVGVKPPAAKPEQNKAGSEPKLGTRAGVAGGVQAGAASKPRPKTSEGQLAGGTKAPANGVKAGSGSAVAPGTVARKPRPAKPATGASAPGIVKASEQVQSVGSGAEGGQGTTTPPAVAAPAPKPAAPVPAKPTANGEQSPPNSPPAETPQ